ncbi:MAG TPA: condensation domain-containing protein, partial [Ktedonobacteraceae bacterium]|nr:condensation domain-containing protein [Ktedonobacteraceae bacterium]
MAEATLFVTGGSLTDPPLAQAFQKSALEQNRAVVLPLNATEAHILVSSGKSPSNQQICIVDPATAVECPSGSIGEIWISGPGVAQGYWNRPEQTTETFFASLKKNGKGPFLRTGDLGFVVDGELFITGRLKDLILIRGRNHYPQDIEMTTERCHPALQAGGCAAFSCELDGEERLIIAQELKRECRTPDIEEISGTIRQAVAAEHELQVHTILLLRFGSIPKTSSGKIQRHACRTDFLKQRLRVIGQSVIGQRNDAVQERELAQNVGRETLLAMPFPQQQTLMENYLHTCVARVAGIHPSPIDPQVPLGNVGLDSLMALELQNEIETRLGVTFSLAKFLSGPSLAQIASDLLNQLNTPLQTRSRQTNVPETSEPYPLSLGQNSLWFQHHLFPASGVLNIAKAVKIQGQLDDTALQYAFQCLVQRHASLRTTFSLSSEMPVQSILPTMDIILQREDATRWDEETLLEHLNERASIPFDLMHGPLLKVFLFTRSPQVHVLLFVAHHIIVDFWSLTILFQELTQLYMARKRGIDLVLPAPQGQYRDYILWQNEMLAGPAGEALWDYWRKHLSGELPGLSLSPANPDASDLFDQGAVCHFQLAVSLTKQLQQLAREEKVTPYMLLLAVFDVLLYRYTGQEDILIGSPTSGRGFSDLAHMIGYFVNPVTIRTNLAGEPTFRDFLRCIRQIVVGAFEHQDYPFALLVERLQPTRNTSGSPFFSVVFNWLKSHISTARNLEAFALDEAGVQLAFGTEILEAIPLKQQIAQFDLELTMAEVDEAFHGALKYNTTLFQNAFIAQILAHFQVLLEHIVAEPDSKISQLPLLTPAEYDRCMNEGHDLNTYAQDKCIHQLLEEQARSQPNTLAISCANEKLTYAELDARSNQFAQGLLRRGVTPGQTVALLLESSVQHIVALFAILKVGGVFVCLDPHYPQERLERILAEVTPCLAIADTQSLSVHNEALRTIAVIVADTSSTQTTQEYDGAMRIDMGSFMTLPCTKPTVPVRATDSA